MRTIWFLDRITLMVNLLFDDSLPQLVATLTNLVDRDFVEAGTALRDASGRLSFVADRAPRDDNERGP